MKSNEAFAKVIKLLSWLVVAFALAFFPPTSAHAAAGVHGGHSDIKKAEASSFQHVQSHSAVARTDCEVKTNTSTSDTNTHQCCAGMCLAAILIEGFASLQADVSLIDLAAPHTLPVTEAVVGFLRPPNT